MRTNAVLALLLSVLVVFASAASPTPAPGAASGPSTSIVIASVETEHNGDAGWEYIELFNLGATSVDISGWHIQYASAAGTGGFQNKLTIPDGTVVAAGHSYLVASEDYGGPVTPDFRFATTDLNLAATAGRIRIGLPAMNSSTIATDPLVIDLLGYGLSAITYETAPLDTAGLSDHNHVIVRVDRCVDTNHNNVDFTTALDHARNSTSDAIVCGTPATPTPAQPATIVIAQVETEHDGVAGAEYIELFNDGSASVDISGWHIQYASANGTGGFQTKVTIPDGVVVPAGHSYLVASEDYTGPVAGDLVLDHDLDFAALAGRIRIGLPDLTSATPANDPSVIDLLGYGSNAITYEGQPLDTTGLSDHEHVMSRKNRCVDTNNNNNDFEITTEDPHNSNSAFVDCTGVTQVPTSTPPTHAPTSAPGDAAGPSTTIVIASVETEHNGVAGQEYIELFNLGASDVDISGWHIQYASATGTGAFENRVTIADGVTLAPGQSYLVASADYAGSVAADFTLAHDLDFAALAGRIRIGLPGLLGTTPQTDPLEIDLLGYGTTARSYEGQPLDTTGLSDHEHVIVRDDRCIDVNFNAFDFTISTDLPRNSASPLTPCQ